MIEILKTLWIGETRRGEERLRSLHAVELIDQKVREAETALSASKCTLASLIQRERTERRMLEGLNARIARFEGAARQALEAGDEALARDSAAAIAEMRNERSVREGTVERLASRVVRLRGSVGAAQRRLVDLRHGAMQARAVRREHEAQARLGGLPGDAEREARDLIRRVLQEDDPLEKAEILRDLDRGAEGDVERRLADAGHLKGAVRAEDVLAELRGGLCAAPAG